jgi:hypothetical protein
MAAGLSSQWSFLGLGYKYILHSEDMNDTKQIVSEYNKPCINRRCT